MAAGHDRLFLPGLQMSSDVRLLLIRWLVLVEITGSEEEMSSLERISRSDAHRRTQRGQTCGEDGAPNLMLLRCTVTVHHPAAGTAAGGATLTGCRHRDGARPAMGSHNPQAVRLSYTNSYQKFSSTSP
ncbi:hypothetical protein ACLOJK_034310, partial [Asimina triloba]